MLAPLLIASGDGFAGWQALNDTIMGGRSQGVGASRLWRTDDAGVRGAGRRRLCELPFACV